RPIRAAGGNVDSAMASVDNGVANTANGFNAVPNTTLNMNSPGYIRPHVEGQQPPIAQAVNPDEQALRMLAQHVQNTDQGIDMPPLPPPLAETLEGPKAQQPTPTPQNNQPLGPPLGQAPPRP